MKMISMAGASTPLMLVLVMALLALAMYSATPTDLSAQAAWGVTASSLPAKSRVSGVALQVTLPITIAAARGSANPPLCAALKKPTVVKVRGKTVP